MLCTEIWNRGKITKGYKAWRLASSLSHVIIWSDQECRKIVDGRVLYLPKWNSLSATTVGATGQGNLDTLISIEHCSESFWLQQTSVPVSALIFLSFSNPVLHPGSSLSTYLSGFLWQRQMLCMISTFFQCFIGYLAGDGSHQFSFLRGRNYSNLKQQSPSAL